jgi:hypothetical protein
MTYHNHLAIQPTNTLLSTLKDAFMRKHILPHFPIMPSKLWQIHEINKTWFKVVGENMPRNALKIPWIY